MPMNATDPKFLSTHTRRPRNIKRRFSAALALWCAWHKRGFAAGALALAPPHGSTHASRPSLVKGRRLILIMGYRLYEIWHQRDSQRRSPTGWYLLQLQVVSPSAVLANQWTRPTSRWQHDRNEHGHRRPNGQGRSTTTNLLMMSGYQGPRGIISSTSPGRPTP